MEAQAPVTVSVRMPAALAEWLKRQASESLRSISAEAVWQLQRRLQEQAAQEAKQ